MKSTHFQLSKLLIALLGVFISFSLFAEEKLPEELKGIGVTEHIGSKVDLDLTFKDETGKTVPLKTYFSGEKPVLFFLVYYECPNLCTFVLNGAIESLQRIDKLPGKDFEIVALSFDPTEGPELAAEKKTAFSHRDQGQYSQCV